MGFMDYIGDNAAQIDAMEYENEVREKDPRLLQSDEDIVFAFAGRGGKGRDHYMLTTKRILIRDKKGTCILLLPFSPYSLSRIRHIYFK